MKIFSSILSLAAISSIALAVPSVGVKVVQGGASKPGKPIKVNVNISVPAGYHIYGPKDKSGIPTSIALVGPTGFKASVMYPKTGTFKGIDGTMEAVYVGQTTIPVMVTVPKSFKGKPNLKFKVTTQACNDRTCLPPHTDEFTIAVK